MEEALTIEIYENRLLVHSASVAGVVELGRQRQDENPPFSAAKSLPDRARRIVIGGPAETSLSRQHLRLEPIAGGRLRLRNLSKRQPVLLAGGQRIAPGQQAEMALPTQLQLAEKVLHVSMEGVEETTMLGALDEPTSTPGQTTLGARTLSGLPVASGEPVDGASIVRWLQHALDLLQHAATSDDFLDRAARSVIDVAGLDSGAALLERAGGWQVVARHVRAAGDAEEGWRPSRRILESVRQKKRTVWAKVDRPLPGSLGGVEAVIVAPILDRDGEVIGALYGQRRSSEGSEIKKADAMLVELLASSAAAGIARVEQEKAAVAARVRFEQFFTSELSRELERRPDLLDDREEEVTILVADIWHFCAISERLGSARSIEWIRDVMTALTGCVMNHEGVVVDYIGDEIMAMWGAPARQPDHARRACAAALDMLKQLPALNRRWRPLLDEELAIGIGVSTGRVQVGNVGSDRKFKYGPLGTTVNLASRIQGATKYLRAGLVVSDTTRSALGSELASRRLCTVRAVHIAEPVELFELEAPGQTDFCALRDLYEKALLEFERRQFRSATEILAQVLARKPGDGPALALLQRAIAGDLENSARFDPVWELPGK